jgi:hypothetical protein
MGREGGNTPFDQLPEDLRQGRSEKEWSWLPDTEKKRVIDDVTVPEWDESA